MAPDSSAPIILGKVLVIGGCGFLGYHLVDQLLNFPSEDSLSPSDPPSSQKSSRVDPALFSFPSLRSRYPVYEKTEVHVLDIRCTHNRLPGATYHEGDICDSASLLPVFRTVQPDVIINTASPLFTSGRDILKKVNVDGTKTLLEVAGGVHGDWGGTCKAFVQTSSSSIIHDLRSDLVNADERWPSVRPHPVEYYTETKAIAEELVLQANNKYNGMLACAIRPAGVLGERDRGGISHGILSTAVTAPDWQLHLQLGDGNNLFDCTYVGNVAFALTLAAEALLRSFSRIAAGEAPPSGHEKVDGEIFFVTNDSPVYFWDVAHHFWTLYGRTISMRKLWRLPVALMLAVGALGELSSYITGRKTKITRQTVKYSCNTRYFNCDKFKRRCGYTPLVGLEEGMARATKSFVLERKAEMAEKGEKKVE